MCKERNRAIYLAMQNTLNARKTAVDILHQWKSDDLFLDSIFASHSALPPAAMEIVYGTVRHWSAIEWIAKRFFKKGRPAVRPLVILYAALYELLWMEHSETYAVVNEFVDIAKYRCDRGKANFINAVLRRASEQREPLLEELGRQKPWIRHSHPQQLYGRWTEAYGTTATEDICLWNNRRPDIALRINTLKTTLQDFQKQLCQQDVESLPHPAAPEHFLLIKDGRIQRLPGYEQGLFYVQDPVTVMAVDLLAPSSDDIVLDVCAAPGGKTCYLWEKMGGTGELTAADISSSRIKQLEENTARMQVDCKIEQSNAVRPENAEPAYTAVLLDAPCSNTGVIRKHPDIRWRFNENRLQKICRLQHDILTATAERVKPGGRIVYSTCSIEPEENRGLVSRWLEQQPGWSLEGDEQILPGQRQTDGAYAALLKKNGTT